MAGERMMHMANSFDPAAKEVLDVVDQTLLERRDRTMGSPYRLFYRRPLHVVRGEGVFLYDSDGRDYLDAYNNVPVVGHSNPRVHDRVSRQLLTLNTHTRYLTEEVVKYAERLLDLFPTSLNRVVFACTGSEAVDLALRIARHHTGRRGVIATQHAYHGTTQAAAEISPSLGVNNPIPGHVALVAAPDGARDSPEDTGALFAARVQVAIDALRAKGYEPAALVVDSVMSSDGLQVEPLGIFDEAVALIRREGGLYIADEVQSGFGRTGDWWGFTRHGLVPDLVVLGKPMGNGLPISALVGRTEVIDGFGEDIRYFNTFGGNPVSVAAAAAVLDELTDRGLLENAKVVGGELARQLKAVTVDDAGVVQVRRAGLFLAIELVTDKDAPDATRAAAIVDHMRDDRVLISASGVHDNVLKIRPPLVFSTEHIERLMRALERALAVRRTID